MKRLIVLLFLTTSAFAAQPYIRLGGALESSKNTIVLDRDCASTEPPALFGCGYDARGDFGDARTWQVAAGVELTRLRLEVALFDRSNLDLDASANFTGVEGEQPVRAEVSSRAAMLVGSFPFAPEDWRVQPFVSVGVGMARNELGTTRYEFPGIAADAVTIMPGGTHDAFAYSAAAGASIQLTRQLALDVTAIYSDLGQVRSEAGEATIVRPNRTLSIPIDATRAELRTSGIAFSLRVRL
ncbi:MAG TPA: hypothetical protein VF618_04655 [Thermoanaerobaculia bacterium]